MSDAMFFRFSHFFFAIREPSSYVCSHRNKNTKKGIPLLTLKRMPTNEFACSRQ